MCPIAIGSEGNKEKEYYNLWLHFFCQVLQLYLYYIDPTTVSTINYLMIKIRYVEEICTLCLLNKH